MLTSSTPTLPQRIERLNSPSVTCRPKAFVNSDSIFGRKLLTLIRNGSATNSTRKTATVIPATRNQRFFITACRCFWRPGALEMDRIITRNRCFMDPSAVPVGSFFLWVGSGLGGGEVERPWRLRSKLKRYTRLTQRQAASKLPEVTGRLVEHFAMSVLRSAATAIDAPRPLRSFESFNSVSTVQLPDLRRFRAIFLHVPNLPQDSCCKQMG